MQRHFTVTGFLVDGDRAALHWHRKNGMWLPAGGHIESDEDPVQAVVREVREETGIDAEVVSPTTMYAFTRPAQLPPPMLILVEDIADGPHQHIDMIYALRPVVPGAALAAGFVWVPEEQLRAGEPIALASCGVDTPVAEDVRVLALEAITIVREAG
ncbi:MAG: NUDIX domain-containing protein [Dehalococcoidia bacterium]